MNPIMAFGTYRNTQAGSYHGSSYSDWQIGMEGKYVPLQVA
jgi:hypothetical protein